MFLRHADPPLSSPLVVPAAPRPSIPAPRHYGGSLGWCVWPVLYRILRSRYRSVSSVRCRLPSPVLCLPHLAVPAPCDVRSSSRCCSAVPTPPLVVRSVLLHPPYRAAHLHAIVQILLLSSARRFPAVVPAVVPLPPSPVALYPRSRWGRLCSHWLLMAVPPCCRCCWCRCRQRNRRQRVPPGLRVISLRPP